MLLLGNLFPASVLAAEEAEEDFPVFIDTFDEDMLDEASEESDFYGAALTLEVRNTIPASCTVTVLSSPEAGGTVSGGGEYDAGASAAVKATANDGYDFAGWYEGETLVCEDAVYSFTAEADRNLTAIFQKLPTYTAIWLDGDGSVLDSKEYVFGSEEEPATEKVPTKAADENHTYTFSGWGEGEWFEDENVTTCTFTPSFTSVPIVKQHTLTVSYVYADGSKAAEAHTETLKEGAAYSVASPAITGFTPDQATVAGTMRMADVKVTVTYSPVKADVTPKAAKIVPSAASITTTYNVSKTISVVIKDQAGHVMSGRKVFCKMNGKTSTGTTDAKGSVTFKTPASLAPKTYTVTLTCDGLSATVKLVVKKAAVKLTAGSKTFKAKTKTKKYTVTLKDNKGKPLKKVKLTLKVNYKTYKATTNSKGKAIFKITKLSKKRKYKATIKFAGNKNYKAVSKKVKITVK